MNTCSACGIEVDAFGRDVFNAMHPGTGCELAAGSVRDRWVKASAGDRQFNGLRQTLIFKGCEYGIFKEKYPPSGGAGWRVAQRPVDRNSKPMHCWNLGIAFVSMRAAVTFVEKWVEEHADKAEVGAQ
jgi:hypothetical protein